MNERKTCPVTHKLCYSQKEANEAIKRVKRARNSKRPKQIPQRSYRCKFCGTYHLTHFRNFETCKVTVRKCGMRGSERYKLDAIHLYG